MSDDGYRRRIRSGRVFYTRLTASYLIRIDGGDGTWWATIRTREGDRFQHATESTATREAAQAAASTWIQAHPVPA